jgi:2-dehydro-3-deoxyphosphogluconate aldolase/(4S)-4-hydroxy-2-oxoglutarate aldolase
MDLHVFKELPLMGILRGVKEREIEPIVETAVRAGLRAVEITMNTDGAPGLIQKLRAVAKDRLMVWAGTVLTTDDLSRALGAGAGFIVMPTLAPDVVARCVESNVPVFPGALTPQEIQAAWNAGAAMVKVFPSSAFGPSYFKEIAGPFPEIELLACGGVGPDNIGEFFHCGAKAASFGGSIFKRDWMEQGAFDRIEAGVKALIDAYLASTAQGENR